MPYTYEKYEPISISLAEPGWRAIYTDGSSLFVEPLIGWGVFHVTVHRIETGDLVSDEGNAIQGVAGFSIPDGSGIGIYITTAQDPILLYYARPGVPDPASLEEARSRQALDGMPASRMSMRRAPGREAERRLVGSPTT